jgi:arylsulfatase A-like enzyme
MGWTEWKSLWMTIAMLLSATSLVAAAPERPNIIFILSDDLGYGDLGCYGQRQIQTPHIDRMAAEGIRFTGCYAGSTVCAPSRCTLMTGYHTGHARIRGNAFVPLQPGDVTVAEILRQAGYTTAIIGKWGLGEAGTTGIPNRKGFDYWFGYLNQLHAHNYYPDFLWRNQTKVPLPNVVPAAPGREFGSGVATKRVVYSHDLFAQEALEFVTQHARLPFFLYLALTIPHANDEARGNGMEVPDLGRYAQENWPAPEKGKAAMITRMDADVGCLMARLRELGIDRKTVVFFTSDNGPHKEGGVDPSFFHSSGPLQGTKRSLHDGGIREPMIVRWPGKIAPGRVSDLPWAFWDVLPTLAELAGAGAKVSVGIDGISVVPTLLDRGVQRHHEFMYWEFHEGPSQQAVRMGDWKAIRKRPGLPLELYDLHHDIAEQANVAAQHPDVVNRIENYLKTARTPSEQWPIRDAGAKRRKNG